MVIFMFNKRLLLSHFGNQVCESIVHSFMRSIGSILAIFMFQAVGKHLGWKFKLLEEGGQLKQFFWVFKSTYQSFTHTYTQLQQKLKKHHSPIISLLLGFCTGGFLTLSRRQSVVIFSLCIHSHWFRC